MDKKLCVIGGGRWGQNHIRTLHDMGSLGGIVETVEQRRNELAQTYGVEGFSTVDDAVSHGFDGFIVATPAETHYPIGKTILESGNHVLIEKPMTLSSKDGEELVAIAAEKSVNLMVGHILLFHPAITKIKELISSGRIGKLAYLYSNRLNFGTVRTKENVFWSFAPHDISVLDYLVGNPSMGVRASGGKYLQNGIDDITMANLIYPENIKSHIFVSWLHPFKEQRLVVIGSEGMISFEDSSDEKDIHLYNKKFEIENGVPRKIESSSEIIPYNKSSPLQNELQYFIDNLDEKIEIADGQSALEVVRVLEKVQELLY